MQGFCWILAIFLAPIIPRIGLYRLKYKAFFIIQDTLFGFEIRKPLCRQRSVCVPCGYMQSLCPVHADGPALAGIEPEHIIRHAECLRRVHAAMAGKACLFYRLQRFPVASFSGPVNFRSFQNCCFFFGHYAVYLLFLLFICAWMEQYAQTAAFTRQGSRKRCGSCPAGVPPPRRHAQIRHTACLAPAAKRRRLTRQFYIDKAALHPAWMQGCLCIEKCPRRHGMIRDGF